MNKILVPTDFSPVADNAINYAAEIASRSNSAIVLLHTYMVPLVSTDVPVYVDYTVLEDIKKLAADKLIAIKERVHKVFPEISIHYIMEEGDVAFQVENQLNQNEYDLVVMGTTGANAISGFLVGSNTYDVIKRSHVPVLAVPKNAIYNEIHKIAFGTNCKNEDLDTIRQVIDFATLFDAVVSLIHIESKAEDEDDLIEWFESVAKTKLNYRKLGFRMFRGKEVFDELNAYLEQHRYSVLALHKRSAGFLESIFKPSLTKQFAFHSDIPLLVYK